MIPKAPLAALRVLRNLRQVSGGAGGTVAVAGASELVPLLAAELRAGGEAAAVTENRADGSAAALVWIGKPDVPTLRAASRAGVPIVGVTEGESLPYVLDTNIVRAASGRGLPVQEVTKALARALGPNAPGVAARLPALRPAVLSDLGRQTTIRNGLLAAATFLPGKDFPTLTLNQAMLVLRAAAAGGRKAEPESLAPELAGVVAAGLLARTTARRLDGLPLPSFLLRGGIALGTTAAVSAVVRRRFG